MRDRLRVRLGCGGGGGLRVASMLSLAELLLHVLRLQLQARGVTRQHPRRDLGRWEREG